MNDLIARLESAAEGSRELDWEIHCVLGKYKSERELAKLSFGMRIWFLENAPIAHYTTSIDAALPWENIYAVRRKFDGTWFALNGCLDKNGRETGKTTRGNGKTEPLARCAAALKARKEEG